MDSEHKYIALDTSLVGDVGANAAIIYSFIYDWLSIKNDFNVLFDDKYWVPVSLTSFSSVIDFLTVSQIKTALNKLEGKGYILRRKLNSHNYNQTNYYSISDRSL